MAAIDQETILKKSLGLVCPDAPKRRPSRYSRKIYQLWIYDGHLRWHVSQSYSLLAPAVRRFEYVIDDDAPIVHKAGVIDELGVTSIPGPPRPHHKDWSIFSYRLVNKETGEVLREHAGRPGGKYRPDESAWDDGPCKRFGWPPRWRSQAHEHLAKFGW